MEVIQETTQRHERRAMMTAICCILSLLAFFGSVVAALFLGIRLNRVDLAFEMMAAVAGWITYLEGALLVMLM